MDPKGNRNTTISLNRLIVGSQFLKKLTKFVVSVSLFSLFFANNFCFSRFTLQLLTHTIDKNYMFLFCNGLLVFVAKYSGLITSSLKPNNQNRDNNNKIVDYGTFESYRDISQFENFSGQHQEPFLAEEVMKTEDDSSENVGLVEEPAKDIYMVQEYQEIQREEEEEEEDQPGKLFEGQEQEEIYHEEDEEMLSPHDQENDCGFHEEFEETIEEEEEEIGESIGAMTAEELNKKFDEFIRKMKEELRIEARRQLIVV